MAVLFEVGAFAEDEDFGVHRGLRGSSMLDAAARSRLTLGFHRGVGTDCAASILAERGGEHARGPERDTASSGNARRFNPAGIDGA